MFLTNTFEIATTTSRKPATTLTSPIATIPIKISTTPTTPVPVPRHPCDGKVDGNHPITNQCSAVYMKCTNGKETYEVSIWIYLLNFDIKKSFNRYLSS